MFLKLLALATVSAFLVVILKKYSRELVIFFEIAVAVIAIIIIKDNLFSVFDAFSEVFSFFPVASEIVTTVFKASAVTVMAKLGSEVCRESGNGVLGDIVELGGRVMLIILVCPFIEKVTEIALAFVK